jgi:protein gp37
MHDIDAAPAGAQALTVYDAACRALAEARSVDEVKDVRDQAVAMAAYARQAKNRDLEADAVEIRLRATRRLDEMVRAQAATVGLASGGEHGGKAPLDGLRNNPSNARPTLASQGIDKNLAHQARVLGKLSAEKFEEAVADARDAVSRAVRTVVRDADVDQAPDGTTVTLHTHRGEFVEYPQPKAKATFNVTNEHVSWAWFTWNPVHGCLHGCTYCFAREIANLPSFKKVYPTGFDPLFHPERLDAPANTLIPDKARDDPRWRRVFVTSMGDLFGKWVPDEWIDQVFASCRANPQWEYLFLTKFPRRYVGLNLPPTAWIGTSVDEQKRVRLAEDAFRQISGVRVKWLSLEPLLAPLQFTDLSMFDWVVIGSQTATKQPDGLVPEFAPPFEWVSRIVAQAREARCAVYLKPNLLGAVGPQSPGMLLPQEEPHGGGPPWNPDADAPPPHRETRAADVLEHLKRMAWRTKRFGSLKHIKIDSGDATGEEPEISDELKDLYQWAWAQLSDEERALLDGARGLPEFLRRAQS